MDKKTQIIIEYEKIEPRHPSLGRIAKKIGVSKTYVHQVIKEYMRKKNALTGQI